MTQFLHHRFTAAATLSLALLVLLAACAPAASPPAADLRPIEVADVRVEIGIGSPIPVEILVSGTWPDLCAQLAQTSMEIEGKSIRVQLSATDADPNCPPDFVGVPFRIAIPLNGVELPEGDYAIEVNGMTTSFSWPSQ